MHYVCKMSVSIFCLKTKTCLICLQDERQKDKSMLQMTRHKLIWLYISSPQLYQKKQQTNKKTPKQTNKQKKKKEKGGDKY